MANSRQQHHAHLGRRNITGETTGEQNIPNRWNQGQPLYTRPPPPLPQQRSFHQIQRPYSYEETRETADDGRMFHPQFPQRKF